MKTNHQETQKHPEHKKLSMSGVIKCTAGAALVASVFFHSPGYSQTDKSTTEKKDTIQGIKKNKNILPMDSIEYNKKVSELIIEINIYRKSKNLCELTSNPILNKTAQEYAEYCINNGRIYGHVDKEGKNPFDRCKKNGYTGNNIWENIFFGTLEPGKNAKYIVNFRKTYSLNHNLAMIDDLSTDIGVGIVEYKNGGDDIGCFYVIDIGTSK